MQNEQSNDVLEQQNEELDSILGTFKDVNALKKSYDSLRSEFTKKTQELSALKKSMGDKVQTPPVDAIEEKTEELTQLDSNVPFWEKPEWQSQVDSFFKEHTLTDNQKQNLASILLEDKEEQNSSPLYKAYAKMLEKDAFKLEDIVKDENFLNNYIYNNEDIKGKIISNYVSSLNNLNTLPEVMPSLTANFGESVTTPKTLSEAKQLASKYFD